VSEADAEKTGRPATIWAVSTSSRQPRGKVVAIAFSRQAVEPGQKLMDIVPQDQSLLIELASHPI
jgi:hypothetical protein